MGEYLFCNQEVAGSNPASSIIWPIRLDGSGHEAFNLVTAGSSPLSVTAELSATQLKKIRGLWNQALRKSQMQALYNWIIYWFAEPETVGSNPIACSLNSESGTQSLKIYYRRKQYEETI